MERELPDDAGLLKRVPAARRRAGRRPALQRFLGTAPPPEPASMDLLEDPVEGKTGICCSGGGIRSAAYNLGALQALQKGGVLGRSKYLSAVSGGSYIAAAFCMVAKTADPRHPHEEHSDGELFDSTHPPFHDNSPEEQYLRNRSSYMAPDGIGKVFLAFRVFMGLAFNLLFLGLPVFALGVVLSEALYGPEYDELIADCPEKSVACDAVSHVPGWAWYALAAAAVLVFAAGVMNLLVRFRRDRRRQGAESLSVLLVFALAGLTVVLVAVPVLVAALFGQAAESPSATQTADAPGVPIAGGAGLGALLLGALSLARERLSAAAVSDGVRKRFDSARKLPRAVRLGLAYVVGAVAGPAIFLIILAYGAALPLVSDGPVMLALAGGAVAVFTIIYWVADLNTWSLHPLYRRRLCTAFALKRVKDEHGRPRAMERRFGNLVPLSRSGVQPGPGPGRWPTLLVCAAANVSDVGATPPGRGVTSFTFSPTEIGGPLIGGASTAAFEKALGRNRERDITLPAAVAMSGAALAPSMGKLTRRPFTFLLALANIRLGVWVPNPRYIDSWQQKQPLQRIGAWIRRVTGRKEPDKPRDYWRMPRPHYLLRELMGHNRVDAPFLYVSDGGHYENLGLVELLRRGCTRVYCFDASGGKTLKELGDALALARSELGVEVEFEQDPTTLLESGSPPFAERCCVTAKIRYPGVARPGRLVYSRTVMTAGLPWDVMAFRDSDDVFPHHSTIDQLYTDQKFEAYRALGRHAGLAAQAAIEPPVLQPARPPAARPGAVPSGAAWAESGAAMVTKLEESRIVRQSPELQPPL